MVATNNVNDFVQHDGNYYVATWGGLKKLNADFEQEWHWTSMNSPLTGNYVPDLHLDTEDNLWIVQSPNLIKLSLLNMEWELVETPNEGGGLHSILQNASGDLFGSWSGQLFQYQNGSLELMTIGVDSTTIEYFHAATVDDNGLLWIAADGGLYTYDGTSWHRPFSAEQIGIFGGEAYISSVEVGNGRIYLGILGVFEYGMGFFYFDGEHWIQYSSYNSDLPYDVISDVCITNEGAWISCVQDVYNDNAKGALCFFDGNDIEVHPVLNSQDSHISVRKLAMQDQKMMAASSSGLAHSIDEESCDFAIHEQFYALEPALELLSCDSQGKCWFAGEDYIGYWQEDQRHFYDLQELFEQSFMYEFDLAPDGTGWARFYQRLVKIQDSEVTVTPMDNYTDLSLDEEGIPYLLQSNPANYHIYQGDTLESFPLPPSVAQPRYIEALNSQDIWIASLSQLHHKQGENWTTFPLPEEIETGDPIWGIEQDQELLYLYTRAALHIIDGQDNLQSYYPIDDPDTWVYINDVLRDSQGRIWVAASAGLFLLEGEGLINVAQQYLDADITSVHSVTEDPAGNILVATSNSGMLVLDESGICNDPIIVDNTDQSPVNASLELFPNPTTNRIQLHWQSPYPVEGLEIRNLQGQLVHSQEFPKTNSGKLEVDVSDLAAGLYLLYLPHSLLPAERFLVCSAP